MPLNRYIKLVPCGDRPGRKHLLIDITTAMKHFLFLFLPAFLFLTHCQSNQGPTVTSAEIVDSGSYELMTRDKVAQQGSVTGYSRAVVDKTLKEKTTTIPLEKGVSFGFRYKLLGSPDGARVPITLKVTHPPVTPPGKSTPQTISKGTDFATIGQININAGWVFEEEWAFVPGKWKIEVFYKGKMLAGQEFDVVKQQTENATASSEEQVAQPETDKEETSTDSES